MTTERYRVTLDREACDGIFACLVRDDRFVEAADGLASIETAELPSIETAAEDSSDSGGGAVTATFADERVEDARQAAAACPVDAISVEVVGDE